MFLTNLNFQNPLTITAHFNPIYVFSLGYFSDFFTFSLSHRISSPDCGGKEVTIGTLITLVLTPKQSQLKYLSPVSSIIKFLNTTFCFLWNIKHHNHATFMNQKLVFQNFIIKPTGNKY